MLASPINDINIHAWDLNRVKHFMQLDIGIQMELCGYCVTSNLQGTSITFVLDKIFHGECIDFLCQEARISNQPANESGLFVYPVNHACTRPPSYTDSQQRLAPTGVGDVNQTLSDLHSANVYTTRGDVNTHTNVANGGDGSSHYPIQPAVPTNNMDDQSVPPRNITRKRFESAMPAVAHPYMNFQPQLFQQTCSSSFESPYQISSRIIITNSGEVQYERNILGNKPQHHGGFHFKSSIPLPPRSKANTTPKPSLATPKASPDTPKAYPDTPTAYPNTPKAYPGTPKAYPDTPKAYPDAQKVIFPLPRSPNRTVSLPTSHPRREEQRANRKLQKRISELSDSDESYVFIPSVVRDPTRVPLPQPPQLGSDLEGSNVPDSSPEGSNVSSPFYVNYFYANNASNGHGTPMGGSEFPDPSLENNTADDLSQYPYHDEPTSHGLPSDFCDPSIQTSSNSSKPQPLVEDVTVSPPRTTETIEETDSFSGAYDDIVLLTQQFSIRPGKGAVPHVIATQEIRSSDSPVPVPPARDYVPHRPVSPNKPQVKPRRNKTFSESDSKTDFMTAGPTTTKKSLTIPKPRSSNSDLSRSPCHHIMLDTTSQDDPFSSTTSPVMDIPHNFNPLTTPPPRHQSSVLNYPPLTPPIPRPRPLFSRFRVGGVQQKAEDDSMVGRNRAGSSHNHQSRLSSTKFHTPFGSVSDL